jgi:hypothetical protein
MSLWAVLVTWVGLSVPVSLVLGAALSGEPQPAAPAGGQAGAGRHPGRLTRA